MNHNFIHKHMVFLTTKLMHIRGNQWRNNMLCNMSHIYCAQQIKSVTAICRLTDSNEWVAWQGHSCKCVVFMWHLHEKANLMYEIQFAQCIIFGAKTTYIIFVTQKEKLTLRCLCLLCTILIVQLLYRGRAGARTVFKHQVNNECDEHKNK